MKQLHYPGLHLPDIIGQVVGPTEQGELLVIYAADWDQSTNVTTAHLRPATQPEVRNALARLRPDLALAQTP